MIRLYNTLTRKKELFKPIKAGHAGIYTCGPTVYWFAHLGNLRSYVFSDTLRRVLEFNGLKVRHIINVTDVGHLTSDSDEGDDKVEEAAKKEGKTAKEITRFYFDAFKKDLKLLNILEPAKWAWATKHIKEQIDLIERLEKKGHTYQTRDGVYFDTSTFSAYGKLSKKMSENLQGGKRVGLGEKKHVTDFALWKFSGDDTRLQEWKSPWGVGFPGWHIECSAMATKYLGTHFDIHTGGIDHIPIHHENEIAQSVCGYHAKRWVNYWMHGEFLISEKEKVSKSSGKIKRLVDLTCEGVDPLAYRYFVYSAHYRKPLTWSRAAIDSAILSYRRLKNLTTVLEGGGALNKQYLKDFEKKINDDLDMPGAIAVLWKLLRDETATGKRVTVQKMDEVLGLDLLKIQKLKIPKNVSELVQKREEARMNKNWKKSDDLRDALAAKGWIVRDTKGGPVVMKHD